MINQIVVKKINAWLLSASVPSALLAMQITHLVTINAASLSLIVINIQPNAYANNAIIPICKY